VRNVLPGLGARVSTTMALSGFGWESAGSKPSHTLLCMITTQFKIAPRVVTDDGDLDGWSAAATQGERELSSLIDQDPVHAPQGRCRVRIPPGGHPADVSPDIPPPIPCSVSGRGSQAVGRRCRCLAAAGIDKRHRQPPPCQWGGKRPRSYNGARPCPQTIQESFVEYKVWGMHIEDAHP
jgi:hypothetical protein